MFYQQNGPCPTTPIVYTGPSMPSSISPTASEVQSALDFSSVFIAYMSSRNAPSSNLGNSAGSSESAKRRGRRGRKKTGPSSPSPTVINAMPSSRPAEQAKAVVDPRKYKTRMCSTWEATGSCPYEHTCCFAHGPEELRDLSSNHKLLASIGYFSNVILLSMSNGQKPALPPHALYEQPSMFQAPQSPEELKAFTQLLPPDVHFPFQDILPGALNNLHPQNAVHAQLHSAMALDRRAG